MNLKNLKSIEDNFNFNQMTIIKEKLDEIKDLYNEFNNVDYSWLNHSETNFHNHPEIFFSLKEIKNIKVNKLLSKGKFGKVSIK